MQLSQKQRNSLKSNKCAIFKFLHNYWTLNTLSGLSYLIFFVLHDPRDCLDHIDDLHRLQKDSEYEKGILRYQILPHVLTKLAKAPKCAEFLLCIITIKSALLFY